MSFFALNARRSSLHPCRTVTRRYQNNSTRPWCLSLLAIALLTITGWVSSARADLSVTDANATIVDEQLRVLLNLELELGDAIEEALQNGIPVTIAVEMELNRTRTWLPNVFISDWRNDFEIRFHSLSSHYIVSETGRGKLASFDTLSDALAAIGDNRLLTVPLPTIPTNPEINYALSIRARLDVEALPTPLRLLGYIMPDWRISSRWTTWPVRS